MKTGLGLILLPWLLLAALVLTGCTQGITMRHPDGRTAECGNLVFSRNSDPAVRSGRCISDFQRQGFERQP
jgi:hypothetical protein